MKNNCSQANVNNPFHPESPPALPLMSIHPRNHTVVALVAVRERCYSTCALSSQIGSSALHPHACLPTLPCLALPSHRWLLFPRDFDNQIDYCDFSTFHDDDHANYYSCSYCCRCGYSPVFPRFPLLSFLPSGFPLQERLASSLLRSLPLALLAFPALSFP